MSYAIIRNQKYKRENLKGIFRHNERINKNYSNDNIDKEKSYLNYSLKSPQYSYEKEFDRIREKYNLKGQIKTVSNIACEYIITSDNEFFNRIGEKETRRFFETAYKFVCEYKNLGEQYIMSAKVHMDEETPHMHLVFCPINKDGKLSAKSILGNQKSLSEWQTRYYEFMHERWNELERGQSAQITKRKHIPTWLFKMADNLDYLYNKLSNVIENINLIGMKKDKAEAMEILSEFVPKARKFSAKVNSYQDYIRELEIKVVNQKYDNKELLEENKELKKEMGDKEFETSMILMNMQNQIKKYEKYIKKVPKDIIEEIERKEREHNYKDKEMER